MEHLYGTAVHEVAVELREIQWQKFIDAAGIRAAVESDSLLVQDVRKAWNLANPISRYLAAADRKIREDMPETCSTTNEEAR